VGLLFDAGDYGAVAKWAQSSRADRFQDPDSFRYRLGESHARTGRADGARSQFEAVSAGPMRPYAFHSLGLLHFAEGRYREALDRLGQAIEAAKSDPDPAVGPVLADRIRLTRGRVVYQFALGAGLAEADRKRLLTLAREQLNVIQPPSPIYPRPSEEWMVRPRVGRHGPGSRRLRVGRFSRPGPAPRRPVGAGQSLPDRGVRRRSRPAIRPGPRSRARLGVGSRERQKLPRRPLPASAEVGLRGRSRPEHPLSARRHARWF